MPTYDYRCKDCNHEFEVFQNISADALTICPACKGTVERVISGGTGLIFKGSGFYITDYKDGNNKADSASNSSSGNGSTKTSDKKDKKTAAASEKKSSASSDK